MRDLVMRLQFANGPERALRLGLPADCGLADLETLARWLYTSGEREGLSAVAIFNATPDGKGQGHWPLVTEGDYIVQRGNLPHVMCPLEHEESDYGA